mgnify:CR=1 FL=1
MRAKVLRQFKRQVHILSISLSCHIIIKMVIVDRSRSLLYSVVASAAHRSTTVRACAVPESPAHR